MTEKSLIVVEKLDAVALYTEGGMEKILTEIEAKVKTFTPDVSTEESRKEITSFAYKITRSKTLLDDLGKELVAEKKKEVKKVDVVRKHARDFCDDLKAGVRKPLDEWEAEDKKRKEEEAAKEREKIEARMSAFAEYGKFFPLLDVAAMTDSEYSTELAKLKEAFKAEQVRLAEERRIEDERLAKEKSERKAVAEKLEKERAELDKQKAEQEANQKKIDDANRKIKEDQEAAQKIIDDAKAAFEAEKKAEDDRKAKAAFEAQAKLDAEKEAQAKVEREAKEAEEKKVAAIAEEARQMELKPDVEKLMDFANDLRELPERPTLNSEDAKILLKITIDKISLVADGLRKSAKEL